MLETRKTHKQVLRYVGKFWRENSQEKQPDENGNQNCLV